MLKKIDHIAIAVSSIDDALKVFGEVFGLKADHIEEIPDQKVKAATVRIGDTNIEFIEPTDPESGVAKFVEKKGEGIHHIAVEVADIDAELKALEDRGVALIDKQARKGLAGRIAFVHPKSTKGVLMELVQKV
jgi:methylmalonyl-CoA epimerase